MDKKRVDDYLKSVAQDFKNIKFEEDETHVKFRIGNFFIKRKIGDDREYAIKKLFEDFLTNTTAFYIRQFWEK